METRNLGNSDLHVTVAGLGCNNFGGRLDLDGTRKVVHKALDAGITLFDTADIYGNQGGSEEFLGKTLGNRRADIVLATKFGKPMDDAGKLRGGSPAYVRSAVEASLRRLRTDWIDLYQMHEPDPDTPIADTLAALEELKRAGTIRAYGCSNFPAAEMHAAQDTARRLGFSGFASFQDDYSLLNREIERSEVLAAGSREGLSLLPYWPLAGGLLTGKYRRGEALPEGSRLAGNPRTAARMLTERNWRKVEALDAFCESRGRSLLELAISWLACRRPVASVIAGASRPEQVEANIKAAGWKLSAEDMAEIDRITA